VRYLGQPGCPPECAVWKLESPEGYNESFLQLPTVFAQLPAQGTPLTMIPNRGVLLATGADEPGGPCRPTVRRKGTIQKAPWPLSGDLLRITETGPELHVARRRAPRLPSLINSKGSTSPVFTRVRRPTLDTHHQAIKQDVLSSPHYGLLAPKDRANTKSYPGSSWDSRRRRPIPKTDRIAFDLGSRYDE